MTKSDMDPIQHQRSIDDSGTSRGVWHARGTVDRRGFLASASAIAAATVTVPAAFARNFGPNAEPVRYPEPDVVAVDKRFGKYRLLSAPIVRLHTGMLWAEGPAWNGVGRYLIWSDIPSDEQLRWSDEDGHVGRRFRQPTGYSNGNTFDYQGRQISCEHGTRRVVRYEYSGGTTVLADKFGGKELNSPNDVVVHPDGSIWFTDPGYGALGEYEGTRLPTSATSPQPLQKEAIYRIDPQSGAVTKLADQPFKPNGLCFSHDYKILYVADTGVSHYPDAKPIIWAFDVDGTKLANPRTFVDMRMDGKFALCDGLRCDEDGNVWASAGWGGPGVDGVHVFTPDGTRIGQIRLPEVCSNVCFGGTKRNRLFMTASQSLYAVHVGTRGAHIA